MTTKQLMVIVEVSTRSRMIARWRKGEKNFPEVTAAVYEEDEKVVVNTIVLLPLILTVRSLRVLPWFTLLMIAVSIRPNLQQSPLQLTGKAATLMIEAAAEATKLLNLGLPHQVLITPRLAAPTDHHATTLLPRVEVHQLVQKKQQQQKNAAVTKKCRIITTTISSIEGPLKFTKVMMLLAQIVVQ